MDASQQNTLEGEEGVDYAHGVVFSGLHDVLPTSVPLAIKLEAEGQECNALISALDYLQKADIEYVAIEWSGKRLREWIRGRKSLICLPRTNCNPFTELMAIGWNSIPPNGKIGRVRIPGNLLEATLM